MAACRRGLLRGSVAQQRRGNREPAKASIGGGSLPPFVPGDQAAGRVSRSDASTTDAAPRSATKKQNQSFSDTCIVDCRFSGAFFWLEKTVAAASFCQKLIGAAGPLNVRRVRSFVLALAALAAVAAGHAFAAPCASPACQLLQGIFDQLGQGQQASECRGDVSSAVTDLQQAGLYFKSGQPQQGVWVFAEGLALFGQAAQDCEIQQISDDIVSLAQKIGHADLQWLNKTTVVLVMGANIYDDIVSIATSFAAQQYEQAGLTIGKLVLDIEAATPCTAGACDVVEGLLRILGVVVEDLGSCKADLGTSWSTLQSAMAQFNGKQYTSAAALLAKSLDQLDQALAPCQLTQLSALIENEAQFLGLGQVQWVGQSMQFIVNGMDIFGDLYGMVQNWNDGDYNAFGADCAALLLKIENAKCDQSDRGCIFIDALLSALKIVAEDMGSCRTDIDNAVAVFERAGQSFVDQQYSAAVAGFAEGLDDVAQALSNCNLGEVASVIEKEAAKLKIAVVQNLGSSVQIIVEGADIANDLYQATDALVAQDYARLAMDLAQLVADIGTAGCGNSTACQFVAGILQSLEIISADLSGVCAQGIEAGFAQIETSAKDWQSRNFEAALQDLSSGLDAIANGLSSCQLDALASLVSAEAKLIGLGNVTFLSQGVQILINGAEVYDDVDQVIADVATGKFGNAGAALGDLLLKVRGLSCTSTVCSLLDGLLQQLSIVAQDWGQCSADVSAAEAQFSAAFDQMRSGDFESAVGSFADALDQLSEAITDCDVKDLATILSNEAQLLHIGHVQVIDDAVFILSLGANLYEDMYDASVKAEGGDWRSAGIDLGKFIVKLASIHSQTGCSFPLCLVVSGVMQVLEVETSLAQCESDFGSAFSEFESAVSNWDDGSRKIALHDIADGVDALASSVADCHVEQVAEIIEQLAQQLGAGALGWLEEIVTILVDGSEIYSDVYGLVNAWSNRNFIEVGVEIAKLAVILA